MSKVKNIGMTKSLLARAETSFQDILLSHIMLSHLSLTNLIMVALVGSRVFKPYLLIFFHLMGLKWLVNEGKHV